MEFSLHIVVFEIEKHSGDKICVAIHTDETLADLHVKVTNALFPVFSSTSSLKTSINLLNSYYKKNIDDIDNNDDKNINDKNINDKNINDKNNLNYNEIIVDEIPVCSSIHDIFIYNKKYDMIISIPNDNNILLSDYLKNNSKYLQCKSKIPNIHTLYTIYVVDDEYLNICKKNEQHITECFSSLKL